MKRRQIFLLLLALLVITTNTYSQTADRSSSELSNWIDDEFTSALDSLHIAGATVALVYGDSLLYSKGYGLADVDNHIPVSDSTTLFGLTAVSTIFVSTAILKLIEEGKVGFDDDINKHLKSIQFENKYDEPLRIRHLLSHTGGIDVKKIGNQARSPEELLPMAEYIKSNLPPQIRPPGEVISYSNFGYALLALLVEDVSGLTFDEYLKKNILLPLEMNLSDFNSPDVNRGLHSKNYLHKDGQFVGYKPPLMHFYPVAAMNSTSQEMANYMSMLLNHGKFNNQVVLDSLTVSHMLTPSFRNYELGNAAMLGPQEKNWNGLQTAELGGNVNGFMSKVVLIPEINIGLFISVNTPGQHLMESFPKRLFDKMFPHYRNAYIKTAAPENGIAGKPLAAFEGKYRYIRYSKNTLEKLALFISPGFEIDIKTMDDGLVVGTREQKLVPVSGLTFYSTEENKYVAFREDTNGVINYYFSDFTAYEKLKWHESLTFQSYLILTIVVIFLVFIFGNIIRRTFLSKTSEHLVSRINITIVLISLIYLFSLGFTLATTDPFEFTYGLKPTLKGILLLPFGIIVMTLLSFYMMFKSFIKKEKSFWKFNYLVNIASLLFIAWLISWNLIGYNV